MQKTLASVRGQTFTDYEHIVIDAGSTDGSVDIIKKNADKLSYWVSEPDKGIYNGMNKGIRQAKGEYCLFLNSGDYLISDDILKKISSELGPEDIVFGNGRREIPGGKSIPVVIPNNPDLYYFSSNSLFHQAAFIKRSLFDKYGLYNETNKIVSDWEFFIKTMIVNEVKAKKIPFEIAVVEESGISRDPASGQLLKEEIDRVLKTCFPPAVIELIRNHTALKQEVASFSFRKLLSMLLKKIIPG